MTTRTLFGELALRLGTHPENVATEALVFILSHHAGGWPSLRALLSPAAPFLPETLSFKAQATGEDASTPDLVGEDPNGRRILVVESKFWATLTDNQPVSYLRHLPSDRPGLLLFLAPESRLTTLWAKLLGRCADSQLRPECLPGSIAGLRVARFSSAHVMVLASWRAVLTALARDADSCGAAALAADIVQLRGLCDRQDSMAFLPIREDELGPEVGRRVQQLADLVDTVVSGLVSQHGATTANLSTGGWQATYGRFFEMGGLGCFFCLSPSEWAEHGEPLWLSIQDPSGARWQTTPYIRDCLARHCLASHLAVVDIGKRPSMCVRIPTRVEEQDVLAALTQVIVRAVEACRPAGSRSSHPSSSAAG